MNPVAVRLIAGWVIAVGAIAGILLGLLPLLGLFPWIRMNGVMWFAISLAIVLVVVYLIGSVMGLTETPERTATGGGNAYDSKGSRRER